jgi:hypothetical protein
MLTFIDQYLHCACVNNAPELQAAVDRGHARAQPIKLSARRRNRALLRVADGARPSAFNFIAPAVRASGCFAHFLLLSFTSFAGLGVSTMAAASASSCSVV